MKRIYIIGGAMGIGKTSVCQALKIRLPNSVFLDGDWCWDSNPFVVNNETKNMVELNICFVLNQFLRCSVYENIIFCWVMDEQKIIDGVIDNLLLKNCDVKLISLMCNKETLYARLKKDIECGIRQSNILEKSLRRIPLYDKLNTIKIFTDNKSVEEIVDTICELKDD